MAEPDPDAPTTAPTDDTASELARVKAALHKANKEAEDSRRRLKEIDDQGKSETQRLADELAAANARADAAESKAIRMEVAMEKGLTPAQARRLVGSTLEELNADADDLLATFGGKPADPAPETTPPPDRPDVSGRPKPSLAGGSDPTQAPEPSIRDVIGELPRA